MEHVLNCAYLLLTFLYLASDSAFFVLDAPFENQQSNKQQIKDRNMALFIILILGMRTSLVVRASDCQCTSCNGPGFDPSILRHSGI
jgi:hypothetical protein